VANSLTLDLNAITYVELQQLVDHLASDDLNKALRIARRVIVAWDYEIPLTDPDPFPKLDLGQPYEVVRTILDNITKLTEDKWESVVVDFKKAGWNYGTNLAFLELRHKKDWAAIEQQLRNLVGLEKPMSATQGAIVFKAYSEAYNKAVSGKN
jgi:hypothetical protein